MQPSSSLLVGNTQPSFFLSCGYYATLIFLACGYYTTLIFFSCGYYATRNLLFSFLMGAMQFFILVGATQLPCHSILDYVFTQPLCCCPIIGQLLTLCSCTMQPTIFFFSTIWDLFTRFWNPLTVVD